MGKTRLALAVAAAMAERVTRVWFVDLTPASDDAEVERAVATIVGAAEADTDAIAALVGRQPFGGFRMSGIGSKAGGPDYLLQFVVPRTVTENTLRRGFAPESD